MTLLLLALLHVVAEGPGHDALMLRLQDSGVGDCMVFLFEEDKRVRIGFYIMDDDDESKPAILHLTTFLERYLASAKERRKRDVDRLNLDQATIEKLDLAVGRQVSLIKRCASRLMAETEKAGLTSQFKIQSDEVKIAGALLASAAEAIDSSDTLYSKIISSETDADVQRPKPQFMKGGFADELLSDAAWSNIPGSQR